MQKIPFDITSQEDVSFLSDKIGNASVIMLGEASHGTHEYYTWRAAITKKLIMDKKISFIAVEGDWPDCYKINRYVKGYAGSGKNIREILKTFDRWPTWMWANWEIAALAEWLKEYNTTLFPDDRPDDNAPYDAYFPHRAIGVVYRPERELVGNYASSLLAARYDAFISIDKTHALHPVHIEPDGNKMPETYPFGI